MYLKSLVLRGFKSFASTTTLRFEPGVTCVVGPNGSGKSNVVDALSWVMGEQGAKTLRGGKMEDVIFAGTGARAPLGRAEVLLTIDNADGALPIDYTEVTISRTMFRSGGSEYAINGSTCRLLDVQELLSDSGIGREMHVIVGQGQLDTILNATPETRRGLIEEAAGVLKHRKRKEKAQRKLDATALNLNRLQDLLGEIRRQLKPLGKQAEVAQRASSIQAELFDASARLLADDFVQASARLRLDSAAEEQLKARRLALEQALYDSRAAEQGLESSLSDTVPELNKAQETWFLLAGAKERAVSTSSIASERLRHVSSALNDGQPGRDPQAIEREIAATRAAQEQLSQDEAAKSEALEIAEKKLAAAEGTAKAAEDEYAAAQRAVADRREGLARINGEVNAMRGRVEASAAEIERFRQALVEAQTRQAEARETFAQLEARLASWRASEPGLDAAYETAEARRQALDAELAVFHHELNAATSKRAALAARADALRLGLERGGAESALLATSDRLDGLLGSVATLVSVPKGYEVAIAAALGAAADAVAVLGLDNVVASFELLKREDLGRAGMLLAGVDAPRSRQDWPELEAGVQYACEIVSVEKRLRPAIERLLFKVAVVEDVDQAVALVKRLPELTVVTKDGDLLSSWYASGGSSAQPSLIEIQSAVADAEEQLTAVQTQVERLRLAISHKEADQNRAQEQSDAALDRLNESDAAHAALAEEAVQLNQTIRSAQELIGRYTQAIDEALAAQGTSKEVLAALEERLRRASVEPESQQIDPAEKDRLSDLAVVARSEEMRAQLELRTIQERVRALRDRVETLEKSAAAERNRLAQAAQRRIQLEHDRMIALAVQQAVDWLGTLIEVSLGQAARAKDAAQAKRARVEQELRQARAHSRELAKQFEDIVDSGARDQLAKAEQQHRLDSLREKAMEDLGYEPEALVAEYGPDQPIRVQDDQSRESIELPYIREEQEKRYRAAKRDLAVLGKVNPLALEEFEALRQRHAYLAEQLEDLRKTRNDLIGIIDDVDERMRKVFEDAYNDVAREFQAAFDRLFPGGEGKLILTEPDSWLTAGVDVEAKPAGKKVKRLSLLSGGERSLVAIAFLVALFKARPSPFYILDEVEAALDDTNLSRLLGIYQELRDESQLLVITHQKRTMEIADALYGVTMGSDGVSVVVSQRMAQE